MKSYRLPHKHVEMEIMILHEISQTQRPYFLSHAEPRLKSLSHSLAVCVHVCVSKCVRLTCKSSVKGSVKGEKKILTK